MTELRSSVLVISHPNPESVLFGADFAEDFNEMPTPSEVDSFNVIAFPLLKENLSSAIEFLSDLRAREIQKQIIVILNPNEPQLLRKLGNISDVFSVLPSYSATEFESTVQLALEKSTRVRQKIDLAQLAHEQNQKLKNLSAQLEEMVEKRGANLIRSRKRLLTTNHKIQTLHKALVAIHQAKSVGEMGGLVNEALSNYLKLSWTRIFFSSASSLNITQQYSEMYTICSIPLLSGPQKIGEISFARGKEAPYTKEQIEFLHQVAEGVALALDRLTKNEQAEALKQQWEATFDAISEPICLTDRDFVIHRTNREFSQRCGKSFNQLVGKNCFDVFLGQDELSQKYKNKDSFQFRAHSIKLKSEATFEVSGQTPIVEEDENPLRLILFRDITEQISMERQILESAKMAEIGTIGSSIAHELNNPLGGMISFLQLIKMDLEPDSPISEDIDEMQKAANRCKEIIENLLGFSRKYDSTSKDLDLKEVILQSIKITELQTRSRGVKTILDLPEHAINFKGNFNLLSQATCNLLQNAFDAIAPLIKSNPKYQGEIGVKIEEDEREITISITDNGQGIEKELLNKIFNPLFTTKDLKINSGLGLTVAFKIISEHQGQLTIRSQPNEGTTAKITLKRPDSST